MAEKHLEVQEELNAIQEALGNYALLEEKTPPAYLKEKIAAAIKVKPTEEKKEAKIITMNIEKETLPQSNNRFYKYAAAAAVALLICSSVVNYSLYSKLQGTQDEMAGLVNEKNVLAGEVQMQKINFDNLNRSMAVVQSDMKLLKNPNLVTMEMKGKDPAPDAKAMVYCDSKTNEIFLEVDKLPAAPEGMQYQFWAIVDGKPVDAGMIELCEQPDTCGIHPMKTIANAHAFAISLEKKGGNPSPLGSIYATFGI